MTARKSDFTLTSLDDLFSTQEQRDDEKLSKIKDIPISDIDDFPDHPFKVKDDEDMRKHWMIYQKSYFYAKGIEYDELIKSIEKVGKIYDRYNKTIVKN